MRLSHLTILLVATFVFAALPAIAQDPINCVSDCDCPTGELCTRTGVCESAVCPQIFLPVCGLDGKTYGNACEANAAHIVIAHEGECGEDCGGISGKMCPKGKFCNHPPDLCKVPDAAGTCVEVPDFCPEIYEPVCGCNRKTYVNDCFRIMARVQKLHDGACELEEPDDDLEVCRSNADCDSQDFCKFPTGACGGDGACALRPEVCPQIVDPVCGCNGVTYSNSCYAWMDGVSVRCDSSCTECR